jgi:uncharacterized LabA/DUF88 family protein
MTIRVAAFVDGFNLYHAVHDTGQNHLKWVNLKSLCEEFAPSPTFSIEGVYYFRAYAKWRKDAYRRHKAYVRALNAVSVTTVMGKFKEKDRNCFSCGSRWKDHEEKETDVNIALYMLDLAYQNSYDRALLISADSDLAPPIRMLKSRFPKKDVRVLTPLRRNHSLEIVRAVGGLRFAKKIKQIHLERNVLPKTIGSGPGKIRRPNRYDPPAT